MQVKTIRREGSTERAVLTGMIMNRTFLGTIAGQWKTGMFPAPWSNIIAGWCITHYKEYGTAPRHAIRDYFEAWAERGDRETIGLVQTLLECLADEYARLKESVSPEYLLDKASELFESKHLKDVADQVQVALENGDLKKARSVVESSRRVEIGLGSGINLLTDEGILSRVRARQGEVLVEYPGAAGNFFSKALCRDTLIGFMGMEKVGKSFWLQDMAFRAVEQGRRVAYFETGDSSEPQVAKRLFSRICGRPFDAGRYEYPMLLEPNDGNLPPLDAEWREFTEGLSDAEVNTARATLAACVGDNWRLSCHENSSVSVSDISTILENYELDGWTPDVIVVDYADILRPLDGRAETRDQINATWKALRALSQRTHTLVVTATQTDADAYDAKILGRNNFSEDKRKYAHVNGMVGINQNAVEKSRGMYRLNWVVLRELEFSEKRCCYCAGNLAYANPAMLSTF